MIAFPKFCTENNECAFKTFFDIFYNCAINKYITIQMNEK